ncbi:MAG: triose-phosphate isomerase [Erysipelotrichales bacterium]
MRKPIIIGNWKMNKSIHDSIIFIDELGKDSFEIEVGIAPQMITLPIVNEVKGNVLVGAQNANDHLEGAYTGEVSIALLQEINSDFCIVGHSERRQYYNETNKSVNDKTKLLLDAKIMPVVCVGESLEEYEAGKTNEVIKEQINNSLADVSIADCVVAYEPVWAIGTGKTATTQTAQEVCKFIREELAKMYSQEEADKVRIQYGGSVKPSNIGELMACPDIDGALVGGASLEIASFKELINY